MTAIRYYYLEPDWLSKYCAQESYNVRRLTTSLLWRNDDERESEEETLAWTQSIVVRQLEQERAIGRPGEFIAS